MKLAQSHLEAQREEMANLRAATEQPPGIVSAMAQTTTIVFLLTTVVNVMADADETQLPRWGLACGAFSLLALVVAYAF